MSGDGGWHLTQRAEAQLKIAFRDVPRFVDQSIGANQHGDLDVLNNLTEVHLFGRTDQTDRAVPRASWLELRLEPRPGDRIDRTRARLPRPTRHSKTHGRARLDLGREKTEDGHAFSSGGPSGKSRKRPYLYPVHPSGSDEPEYYLKGHLWPICMEDWVFDSLIHIWSNLYFLSVIFRVFSLLVSDYKH